MVRDGANSQGETQRFVQEIGMANYAERRGNRAKVGVCVIAKEGDFLTVLFGILQQMRTEEIVAEGVSWMMWMGISPSRKNSKSSAMKASGGCKGQAEMH